MPKTTSPQPGRTATCRKGGGAWTSIRADRRVQGLPWLATAFLLAIQFAISAPSFAADADRGVMRCGWYSNPTPANLSLFDRDAEWIIGVQGGHQAAEESLYPDFAETQWVSESGSYGYGCACLQVEADSKQQVVRIHKATAKELKVCRTDRALAKWRDMFK